MRILGLLLLTMVTACSGISVSTDYTPDYDFSGLLSYRWLEPTDAISSDPIMNNSLTAGRIVRAVDEELLTKGYAQHRAGSEADFLVSYHITSREKIDVTTFHGHYGYYPCWHCGGLGWGSDVWVRQYTEGTVVIDVIEPKQRKLLWRGVSSRPLRKLKTPAERELYIKETINAILQNFPPQ